MFSRQSIRSIITGTATQQNLPILVEMIVTTILVATIGVVLLYVSVPSLRTLYRRLILKYKIYQSQSRDADAIITALYTYPVKSLPAISTNMVRIGSKGWIKDRQYMLVQPLPIGASTMPGDETKYRFLTQRQYPVLTQIQVALHNNNNNNDRTTATTTTTTTGTTTNTASTTSTILLDDNPDESTMTLHCTKLLTEQSVTISQYPAKDAPVYESTLWGDIVQVQDMGDDAAKFVQRVLDLDSASIDSGIIGSSDTSSSSGDVTRNVRLVIQYVKDQRTAQRELVPDSARTLFGTFPAVSLADGFPILIASEDSLDVLNQHLVANHKVPIPMSRFRPNLVVRGLSAFDEDRIKVLLIESRHDTKKQKILLYVVSSCPRCKESCTCQESGIVSDEPVSTMRQFRQKSKTNVYFAVNAIPAPDSIGQLICVGDTVKVLEWGEPVWGEG